MRALVFLASSMVASACSDPPRLRADATPWPEADALFRDDARWLGADAAYSVALDGARSLWLFGDTFVATSDASLRSESQMVRNTIALTDGLNPASANVAFYVREEGDGDEPGSFFSEMDPTWLWPLHGIHRQGDTTLFMLIEQPGGALGFEAIGTAAFRIPTTGDPAQWAPAPVPLPDVSFPVAIGASVLAHGDHVYAYAAEEPGDHDVYLLRWGTDAFDAGELAAPDWHDGGNGWVSTQSLDGPPEPVFRDGQTEFSVSFLDEHDLFVAVQTEGFGQSSIGIRTAPAPEGPWSDLETVYMPPEAARPDAITYAAKAHPQLEGADLVVTYASNARDFDRLVADTTLYFPRFVRLTLSTR